MNLSLCFLRNHLVPIFPALMCNLCSGVFREAIKSDAIFLPDGITEATIVKCKNLFGDEILSLKHFISKK